MRPIRDIFRSYGVLDYSGRHVDGTDKETNHHYGNVYEQLFCSGVPYEIGTRSTRNDVTLMMEVGIADGSSLLAWSEVFPNALCVGLDIHHSDRAHGERIEFYLGDQRKRVDCERAAGGRKFDLIVDDATHEIENTLLTLYWLWPFVKPGGLYVVEEWPEVDRGRILALWPFAVIIDTVGPFGGVEPLVVFRKPT